MKSTIEKPPAAGIAEGFDELNSIFDAAKYTITLRVCAQRFKPSLLFIITSKAEAFASGAPAYSYLKSTEEGQR